MSSRISVRRATTLTAFIAATRMFGLFLLLPVLPAQAGGYYSHATPALIGLAIGAYGVTQALLQLPFGWLSDKLGRRRIIAIGLLLFIGGSIVCALATSIYVLILGRLLQGSGAVASALIALLADLTEEHRRTIAFAWVGICIGAAFLLSIIIAPLLTHVLSIAGFFWLIAALGGIAIGCLALLPAPQHQLRRYHERDDDAVISRPALYRLAASALLLHATLSANFIAIPHVLIDSLALPLGNHWQFYLPVMAVAVAGMGLLFRLLSPNRRARPLLVVAVLCCLIGNYLLMMGAGLWFTAVALTIYFIGFNVSEAMIPSLTAKLAQARRGFAFGVVGTAQFFGAFIGAFGGGLLQQYLSQRAVFWGTALLCCLWYFIVRRITVMQQQSQ